MCVEHLLGELKKEDPSFSWEQEGREPLKQIQQQYLHQRKWKLVKLINHIFLELDVEGQQEKVSYFPPKLLVEHTNLCNAQCIMCSHFYTDNFGRGFIEDSVIRKLEEILPYADKVLLHGIGEPFLHPRIADYIALYRSYGAEVSCNTNLSIMDKALAQCIRDSFQEIVVSCDSPVQETFEQIRRKVSFGGFCKNARLLRETCPDLHIRMNVVAMRQNLKQLPDIIPFAEQLGVDSVAIMDLTAQKLMGNEWDEIGRYPHTARYYLEKVQEAAAGSKVRLISIPQHIFHCSPIGTMEEEQAQMERYPMFPDAQAQRRLREAYQKLNMVKPLIPATVGNVGQAGKTICQGICNNFAETPFLSPTGELFGCCTDGVHVYGNLKEAASFGEIWNGEAYRAVRRNFYQGKLPKYCNACSFLKGEAMSRLKLVSIDETFYENEFSKLLQGLAEQAE
ncbi:MAG: radical SAM protein [Lachnospiraceae bacterium]|jgi:MoaA/NifB/PqqE/SkfB family radical SAM enzyme|nr:radical SAM protein [Lachnospiraceae bacterium]